MLKRVIIHRWVFSECFDGFGKRFSFKSEQMLKNAENCENDSQRFYLSSFKKLIVALSFNEFGYFGFVFQYGIGENQLGVSGFVGAAV